jgi:putative ABC transport system ATP-binding protein
MAVLELQNVAYSYNGKQKVLNDVNYKFERGKLYAIVGKSGAGKTTLLSLLSGLTTTKDGKILYNEKNVVGIDKYEFRSKNVGVVFQSFNLLPHLTGVENIILSMDVSKKKFTPRPG